MLLRGSFVGSLALLCVALLAYAQDISPDSCHKDSCPPEEEEEEVTLTVVVCGERLEEALTMLKSAVVLGAAPLSLHVFADEENIPNAEEALGGWASLVWWRRLRFAVHPIRFPPGTEDAWRTLFKPCACQRLFLPGLLPDVAATLYLDTDTLFHRPPEELWRIFREFKARQVAGLAPEGEKAATNWYTRFARHPFVAPLGVNSGVMLMNLTRMRRMGWEGLLWPLYRTFRRNITWGDQDILNILFAQRPEALLVFGCEWNFRPDHCMYGLSCAAAAAGGAAVVHGSRSYFHLPDKQPAFLLLHRAWRQLRLLGDPLGELLGPLRDAYASPPAHDRKAANCLAHAHVLYAALEESLHRFPRPPKP